MPRNRAEVLEALCVSQSELQFQAMRLRTVAKPGSHIEREHLKALAMKYDHAAHVLATLAGPEHPPIPRRNLKEAVEALGISQGELLYQAERMRQMADEYALVARVIGKLWGYQKGRLEQQEARARDADAEEYDEASVGFYPDDDDD